MRDLRKEIKDLQQALVCNGFELSRIRDKDLWLRQAELLEARAEIYKSICHRQFLLMQMLEAENKFLSNWDKTAKEAA